MPAGSGYQLCLPQQKREPSWKRGWTPNYREIFTHINGKKAPRRFACSAKILPDKMSASFRKLSDIFRWSSDNVRCPTVILSLGTIFKRYYIGLESNHIALWTSEIPEPLVNPPVVFKDRMRTCSITRSLGRPAQYLSLLVMKPPLLKCMKTSLCLFSRSCIFCR